MTEARDHARRGAADIAVIALTFALKHELPPMLHEAYMLLHAEMSARAGKTVRRPLRFPRN